MSNPSIAQPAESGKDSIDLSDAEVQRRIGALVVARGGETHLARELADVAEYIAEARAAVGAMASLRQAEDEFAYATVEALGKLHGAAVTLELVQHYHSGEPDPTWHIETRNSATGDEWRTDGLGACNEFTSRRDAEATIERLRNIGQDWAAAEYRVVES